MIMEAKMKNKIIDHLIYISNWYGELCDHKYLDSIFDQMDRIGVEEVVVRPMQIKMTPDVPYNPKPDRPTGNHFSIDFNNDLSLYLKLIEDYININPDRLKQLWLGLCAINFYDIVDGDKIKAEGNNGEFCTNFSHGYFADERACDRLLHSLIAQFRNHGRLGSCLVSVGELFLNKIDSTERFGRELPLVARTHIIWSICRWLDKQNLRLFVIVHCDLHNAGENDGKQTPNLMYKRNIEEVLENHNTPVLWAHCGIFSSDENKCKLLPNTAELVLFYRELLRKFKHLYLDLSWSAKRLLFSGAQGANDLTNNDVNQEMLLLIKEFPTRFVVSSDYVSMKHHNPDNLELLHRPYETLYRAIGDESIVSKICYDNIKHLITHAQRSLSNYKKPALNQETAEDAAAKQGDNDKAGLNSQGQQQIVNVYGDKANIIGNVETLTIHYD